jgi:N-methylhydantoinase A
VTDAALVLGYLDPHRFLGGRMTLDVAAAERAIDEVATPLGTTRLRTAAAIITIANEHMVNAIREITTNQGIDPRRSALVAGGGAAGLNIAAIATELGADRVLVPRAAGALSAFGGQYSDIVIEQSRSVYCTTKTFRADQLNDAVEAITADLQPFAAALAAQGVTQQRHAWEVEARYAHQVWSLTVPLAVTQFTGQEDVDVFAKTFHALHDRVFAVSEPDQAVEIVHCQGRLIATPYKPPRSPLASREPVAGERPVQKAYFMGHGLLDTTVVEGQHGNVGDTHAGPALVIEPTTTVVVPPEWTVTITTTGDYLMEKR